MNSKIIFAIMGIAVLFAASIGLAGQLTTSSVNRIGGTSGVVPAADVNVQQVLWENNGNFTGAKIKIKNTDSTNNHTYEVCAISKTGSSLSDTAGTSADCATSSSLGPSGEADVTVTFTNTLTNVENTSISIEQTA